VPPSNAKEKSEKVKSSLAPTAKENINMPKQRVMGGDFTRNINSKKDDLDVKKQDIVKIEREKEMASATQGLEKLKTSHSSGEDSSKSSGLPKINNNPEKEDDYKKIKIPRRKRFKSAGQAEEKGFEMSKETGVEPSAGGHADVDNKTGGEIEKNNFRSKNSSFSSGSDGAGKDQNQPENNVIGRKPSVISDKIITPPKKSVEKEAEKKSGIKESNLSSISAKGIDTYKLNMSEDLRAQPGAKEIPLYEKPDVLNNDLKWISKPTERLREELKRERLEPDHRNFVKAQEKTSVFGNKDTNPKNLIQESSKKKGESLIFGSKSEISRSELRQKLRKDPNIWKAQRRAGINLSPEERVKLEKEALPQILGGNISKADLKYGLKKLNQKMASTKNVSERAKIRTKIKFFKKIG